MSDLYVPRIVDWLHTGPHVFPSATVSSPRRSPRSGR